MVHLTVDLEDRVVHLKGLDLMDHVVVDVLLHKVDINKLLLHTMHPNPLMAMDHRTLVISLTSHQQLIHMPNHHTTHPVHIKATVTRHQPQHNQVLVIIPVAMAQVMDTQQAAKVVMKMRVHTVEVELVELVTQDMVALSLHMVGRHLLMTLILSPLTTPTNNHNRSTTITMAVGDLFDYTEYHLRLYGTHSK